MTRVRLAVAVITYRRPDLLEELLACLQQQELPSGYSLEIVVVDNDPEASANRIVASAGGPFPIHYSIEPQPGIPAARQRSVDLTRSYDFVAFIDDDEQASPSWLAQLVATQQDSGADVVTGPVRGILPPTAPEWASHSDVYNSVGRHRTGDRLSKAYTNNALVAREVFESVTPAFTDDFRFTGSSDLYFFQRAHRHGFTIVWNNEAEVTETVPEQRITLPWLVKRAFRSGAGDTLSRRLIKPGAAQTLICVGLGIARCGNGLALLLLGIVKPHNRIKGIRRIASGIGTLAGIVGLNYEEYKRS